MASPTQGQGHRDMDTDTETEQAALTRGEWHGTYAAVIFRINFVLLPFRVQL